MIIKSGKRRSYRGSACLQFAFLCQWIAYDLRVLPSMLQILPGMLPALSLLCMAHLQLLRLQLNGNVQPCKHSESTP